MATPNFTSEFRRIPRDEMATLLERYVRESYAGDMQATAEELAKAVFVPLEEQAQSSEWEVMTLPDLIAHEAKGGGVQWLLENVLARKGIHIISCAPGGTKSWLMLEMARALTAGGQFLHLYDVPKANVLYIDEEMGPDKMSTRVKKMRFAPDSPFFYMGLQQFKLDAPAQLTRLRALVKAQGIEVIFIDTLTRVHNVKDENDNAAMRVIFQGLSELTKDGVTLVVAHHDRKRGGDDTIAHERMRGAQEIGAMADMAFSCEKVGEGAFRFVGTKCRLIAEDDRINVEYFVRDNEEKTETEVYGVSTEERKFVQAARRQTGLRTKIGAALMDGPLLTNQIIERTDAQRQAVINELKTMTEDGLLLMTKNKGQGGGNVYTLPPSEEEVIPNPISIANTASLNGHKHAIVSDTEDF